MTEIFYVLDGDLEHIVNGESHRLAPGMLGYVNPPDMVSHRVDPDGPPARAVVIWAPGGRPIAFLVTGPARSSSACSWLGPRPPR